MAIQPMSADDLEVARQFLEALRAKDTGDFAYSRDRRIELTIRDRKVARYEMRVV
jgi:hypothetical protein